MEAPPIDAAVLASIFCHERGRAGTRATWWAVYCAMSLGDEVVAEQVADRLCIPVDQAQRALVTLVALGVAIPLADGVFACARTHAPHVCDFSNNHSPIGGVLETYVGDGKNITHVRAHETLDWQVPRIVAESGHLEGAIELCEHMAGQVAERGDRSAVRKAHSKAWVLPMEMLIRLDGRDPKRIRVVLDWLHAGRDEPSSFWRGNVLSPTKLRLRWDRMAEQYRAARQGRPSKSAAALRGASGGPSLDEALKGAAR